MKVARIVIKWLLIVFVVVSSLLAARQFYNKRQIQTDTVSYKNLEPLVNGQIQLVLFHNKKRCHQCITMEEGVRNVINEKFSDYINNGSLVFNTMIIDENENIPLVERLGIFAATIVLMEFSDKELTYARVLTRGPELYLKQIEFKNYVSQELSDILMVPTP